MIISKRFVPYAVAIAALGLPPALAMADDPSPVPLTNPYIVLYSQRLALAKANVVKVQAQLSFDQTKLQRDEQLAGEDAVSAEELEDQERATEIDAADLDQANIRVNEADALLQIAKARVAAGQDMPICTPEQ
jgi:hypothetical protein